MDFADDDSDEVRALFEQEGRAQCRSGARVFCAFAAALLIASAVYSWLYESPIFAQLFHIRLTALAAIGAAYLVLSTPYGERYPREIAVVLMLIVTINILALAEWTGGQHSPQYDRVSTVILAAAVMMTWSATWSLAAAGAVVMTFIIHSGLFQELGTPQFTGNLIRMLAAGGIAGGASAVRERHRWRTLARLTTSTVARRRAENEIRRLNEELEQRVLERTAELRASEERARSMFDAARTHQGHLAHVLRVTSMGGMVVELAHELNQPLGAIVNFANGTAARLRQTGADPEVTNAVSRIADEGMRAAEIIRRVREFIRPGGTVRQAIDLGNLAREVVLLIESEAEHDHIPIRLELADGLPHVTADRIQVEQVILNLTRNAIDAMRSCDSNSHELVVRTRLRSPDEVELCVTDTGVGIAQDLHNRIFEPFFTTKPGGLGMGLSISRTIVEAYGGRLWAEQNEGGGMTFAFCLPTLVPEPAPAAPGPSIKH